MEIKTKRLKIVALTPEQLEMLVNNISKFERELHCSYQGEKVEGVFKYILFNQSLKAKKNYKDYLWLTFWIIVRKEDDIVVGMIDFKDVPNAKGEVEIGYGLGNRHEHLVYMTEAVEAFCSWGKKQNAVKTIIAETEMDNFPSQRLLKKCGFIEFFRDKTIWWRL